MCGFNVATADSPKPRLLCSECGMVLRHPVQTVDGIRLCKSCYDEIAGQPGYTSEQTGLSIQTKDGSLSPCYIDKAVQREIFELEVYCKNKVHGCSWRGRIKDYASTHEKECQFVSEACPNECSEQVSKVELTKHLEFSCLKRRATCNYCTTEMLADELDNHHTSDCGSYPLNCDDCHLKVPRNAMEDHKHNHCEHVQCTCGEVLKLSGDEDDAKSVAAHFKNPASIIAHFLNLFTFGTELVDSMSNLGRRLTAIEDKVSTTETGKISQDLSQLQRSTDKRFVEVMKHFEQLEQRQTRQSRGNGKNLTETIKELQSRVQLLEDKGSRQAVEIRVLQSQLKHQLIAKHSQGNLGQSRLSNLERKYEDIERQVTRLKVHVSEMELQLQASIVSTYDGSFMWRISDIMKRKREAINGQVTSLYSPPFYTAKNGYKMCIRIYLNGDGMGHKTHLSLFFVLMKGEYDSLLKWPFDHKVSLILVDQKQRRHIVQTFKPTPESSSFQCPVTDMNDSNDL